jgi:hypothetical protein
VQPFTDFRPRERAEPPETNRPDPSVVSGAIQPHVHANLAILTGQIQPLDCPPDDESDEDLIEPQQS